MARCHADWAHSPPLWTPARISSIHVPVQPSTPAASSHDFEGVLSRISARLIAIEPSDICKAIEATLHDIRTFCRADRSALLVVSDDDTWAGVYAAACDDRAPQFPADVNFVTLYRWAAPRLLRDRLPVRFRRFEDLPPEAGIDIPVWERQGIRSTLCVPLVVGGRISHVISIDAIVEERQWPDDLVTHLRILGELVAGTALRVEAFQALRQSEERLTRAAAASGRDSDFDTATGELWVTSETRQMYGIDPVAPARWGQFVHLIHPDDRARTVAAIEQAIADGSSLLVDYRIVRPDGAERWIHAAGQAAGTRLLGASVDITMRTVADQQLRQEVARVGAAVDVAGLGFSDLAIGGPTVSRRPDAGTRRPAARGDGEDAGLLDRSHRSGAARRHPGAAPPNRRGEVTPISFECRYAHPWRGWIWLRHVSRRMLGGPWGDDVHLVGAVRTSPNAAAVRSR